jgi:hypothetical protein
MPSTSIDEQAYLKERVESEITWHDDTSTWNKKYYQLFRTTEFCLAAFIPVLSTYADIPWVKWPLIAFGILVALSGGISKLWRFQENWICNRVIYVIP